MNLVTNALRTALVGLLLAGCSASPTATTAPVPAATTAASTDAFLARHDLQGLSTQQVVDRLDATQDDRASGLVGSVKPDAVVLTDAEGGRATLAVPADAFYLSIAPYLTKTHDCFHHNLASCQGELVDEAIRVRVTDAAGATLVDRDVTTFANGFAGLWLPRGITATLTVEALGRSATTPISTGADDPTCLTTLQLG